MSFHTPRPSPLGPVLPETQALALLRSSWPTGPTFMVHSRPGLGQKELEHVFREALDGAAGGAGTSAEHSGLLCCEMCIENMPRSIRSQRSGSRDNKYSLHAQMSPAISQMKIEIALIISPGTDGNGLPRAPPSRLVSRASKSNLNLRLGRTKNGSISSTPLPPFYR